MNFAASESGMFPRDSRYREQNSRGRREEILADFADNFYGTIPKERPDISPEVLDETPVVDPATGEIIAIRKQVALTLSREGKSLKLVVLIYTPPGEGPFSAVLSLNMYGNHSLTRDPDVIQDEVYLRGFRDIRIPFNEEHRGSKQNRLPIKHMVREGNAVVTAYYWPITPDYMGGLGEGIYKLYPEIPKDRRGAISAWAGGMMHLLSYLEEEPLIDHTQVTLLGFSRIGKTAQWAGANDTRVAGVASFSSGKGGAALLETQSGEPDWNLDLKYRHWFKDAYSRAKKKLLALRRNSPSLLSLLPRAFIATAREDDWSAHDSQKAAVERANEIRTENGAEPIEFHTYSFRKNFGHGISADAWREASRFARAGTRRVN